MNINNRKDIEMTHSIHVFFILHAQVHTCNFYYRTSLMSSGVSHYSDIHTSGRGWKRADEILHGAWESRRLWRSGLHGLLLTGWYTVFGAHANISHIPGILQEKVCRTVWHSTCYRHFWPKRVTNHWVTGLFRQPWWVILPVRERAGNRKCAAQKWRAGWRRSKQPRWSTSDLRENDRKRSQLLPEQSDSTAKELEWHHNPSVKVEKRPFFKQMSLNRVRVNFTFHPACWQIYFIVNTKVVMKTLRKKTFSN